MWSKLFQHMSKFCLNWNSIASYQKYSRTNPKFFLAESRLRLFEKFQDNSELSFSRKHSETIPNCISAKIHFHLIETILRQFQIVSAEIQMHLIEKIPRQHQIVSKPKFNCIIWKLFWVNSKNVSWNSIETYRIFLETLPSCILPKSYMHFFVKIPIQFQFVC